MLPPFLLVPFRLVLFLQGNTILTIHSNTKGPPCLRADLVLCRKHKPDFGTLAQGALQLHPGVVQYCPMLDNG